MSAPQLLYPAITHLCSYCILYYLSCTFNVSYLISQFHLLQGCDILLHYLLLSASCLPVIPPCFLSPIYFSPCVIFPVHLLYPFLPLKFSYSFWLISFIAPYSLSPSLALSYLLYPAFSLLFSYSILFYLSCSVISSFSLFSLSLSLFPTLPLISCIPSYLSSSITASVLSLFKTSPDFGLINHVVIIDCVIINICNFTKISISSIPFSLCTNYQSTQEEIGNLNRLISIKEI